MILPAHDFRSHVAGRTRRIFRVLWVPNPCDAEVCDPHVAMLIENKILRLNIPMQDAVSMQVLQTSDHTRDKEFWKHKISKVEFGLLVYSSLNRLYLPMWNLKSPPDM